jgi:hypothetical protein
MTTSRRCAPARPAATRTRPVTRAQLLRAAALGTRTATADLQGSPEQARAAVRTWQRLRRSVDAGQPRALLGVAYDTGYGRGMSAGLPALAA